MRGDWVRHTGTDCFQLIQYYIEDILEYMNLLCYLWSLNRALTVCVRTIVLLSESCSSDRYFTFNIYGLF